MQGADGLGWQLTGLQMVATDLAAQHTPLAAATQMTAPPTIAFHSLADLQVCMPPSHSSLNRLSSKGTYTQGQQANGVEVLQALLTESVEAAVGEPVAAEQPLMAAGLDSLAAAELQQSLAASLGLTLPPTLIFDYPTISALAAHLHALQSGQEAAARSGSPQGTSRRHTGSAAVIAGIAGNTRAGALVNI